MDENALVHRLIDLFHYKDSFQQQSSGIAPQDMYVLERIRFRDKIQGRDLSRMYSIPPSTLTGILDRLEKKQYIRRERKSDDRRAVELAVTDGGNAVLRRHIEEDRLFAGNLFRGLDGGQRTVFLELLKKLLNQVKKDHLFDPDGRMMGDGRNDAN